VYFETEKEANDDFISQVWTIIELIIKDIRSFIEVMQSV
jgi:hypothetical protein